MKKVSTLLFASTITLFLLSACSSDDNAPAPQPEPVNHLLGKWKLNTMSIKSYEDGELVGENNDLPVASQITWEYEFKADLSVEYYMAIPAAEFEEKGKGTYSTSGSSITITIDGEPGVFEISKNDADNLHLKMTEEEESGGVIYKEEMEQKFIRK